MGNVNKPHQTVADSKYPRRPSNQSGDGKDIVECSTSKLQPLEM